MADAVEKINLEEKFGSFQEQWKPKIIGELNDSHVKAVKLQGDFVWHHHDKEDELFLVVKGTLIVRLRDREIEASEGEMVIVPAGVEHMTAGDEEVWAIMIEPKSTLNTGNIRSERTVPSPERI